MSGCLLFLYRLYLFMSVSVWVGVCVCVCVSVYICVCVSVCVCEREVVTVWVWVFLCMFESHDVVSRTIEHERNNHSIVRYMSRRRRKKAGAYSLYLRLFFNSLIDFGNERRLSRWFPRYARIKVGFWAIQSPTFPESSP